MRKCSNRGNLRSGFAGGAATSSNTPAGPSAYAPALLAHSRCRAAFEDRLDSACPIICKGGFASVYSCAILPSNRILLHRLILRCIRNLISDRMIVNTGSFSDPGSRGNLNEPLEDQRESISLRESKGNLNGILGSFEMGRVFENWEKRASGIFRSRRLVAEYSALS